MSDHITRLAESLAQLSRDDRVALVERLVADLGPSRLNAAASSPQTARLARLNAAMDNDSVALRNATAELRRLGVRIFRRGRRQHCVAVGCDGEVESGGTHQNQIRTRELRLARLIRPDWLERCVNPSRRSPIAGSKPGKASTLFSWS